MPSAVKNLRPAVFLDRDGTLNVQVVRAGKPYPPATLAEFALFLGVPEACAQLADAGYVLVVATNQPDVGRGDQAQSVVEAMHTRLRELVPAITHIEVCYAPGQGVAHAEDYRRKPAPGMTTDAARSLGLDLARSWMVGDRWRDIDCGQRAGLRTVFIDFGYDEVLRAVPDFTFMHFTEAAAVIFRGAAPASPSYPNPNSSGPALARSSVYSTPRKQAVRPSPSHTTYSQKPPR